MIPAALDGITIHSRDNTSNIRLNMNFFLNVRPATDSPHFVWQLPEMGSVHDSFIVSEKSSLPKDLKITLVTESRLRNGRDVGTSGVITVPVDASGNFQFEEIATGTLSIQPFLSEDQPLRAKVPENLVVRPNKDCEFEIPIVRGVLVRGIVRKSDTQQGYPKFHLGIGYGHSAHNQDFKARVSFETDKNGRFSAYVLPGPIKFLLGSAPLDYRPVLWWQPGGGKSEVPSDVESFDLDPIELVPTETIEGLLVDADNQPLVKWDITGFPELDVLPREA